MSKEQIKNLSLQYFNQANQFYSEKKYQEAVDSFCYALENSVNDVFSSLVYFGRALSYLQQDNLAEANEDLRKAGEINPSIIIIDEMTISEYEKEYFGYLNENFLNKISSTKFSLLNYEEDIKNNRNFDELKRELSVMRLKKEDKSENFDKEKYKSLLRNVLIGAIKENKGLAAQDIFNIEYEESKKGIIFNLEELTELEIFRMAGILLQIKNAAMQPNQSIPVILLTRSANVLSAKLQSSELDSKDQIIKQLEFIIKVGCLLDEKFVDKETVVKDLEEIKKSSNDEVINIVYEAAVKPFLAFQKVLPTTFSNSPRSPIAQPSLPSVKER